MLMGLVPNYGLSSNTNSRRIGRMITIPKPTGTESFKTLNERSLGIEGAKLFNSMPRCIREHAGSLDSFKTKLDKFLQLIPDEPRGDSYMIPGAYQYAPLNTMPKTSNSIKDWVRCLRLQDYRIEDEEEMSNGIMNSSAAKRD